MRSPSRWSRPNLVDSKASAAQIKADYAEYAQIRARGISKSLGARPHRPECSVCSDLRLERRGHRRQSRRLAWPPRFNADIRSDLARKMLALSDELSTQLGFARAAAFRLIVISSAGHAAPDFTQAATSAPAICCVPGAGCRPQPVSRPSRPAYRCRYDGQCRPASDCRCAGDP